MFARNGRAPAKRFRSSTGAARLLGLLAMLMLGVVGSAAAADGVRFSLVKTAQSDSRSEYSWRRGRKWESLKIAASGDAQSIPAGSHAEFITEHYWGYTALRSGCSEYRVEHPRWKIWNANSFEFKADVATLYGAQFSEVFKQPPRSAFIAEGSPIIVHKREVL